MTGPAGVAHYVVTAGGTRESIDPIRYLSNRSSGKMGFALARAAHQQGARVTLISTQPVPESVNADVIAVESAAEMQGAVINSLRPGSVLLMAAAVADYRPRHQSVSKVKKTDEYVTLELVRNPDILGAVSELPIRPELFVVGFAAETDDPVPHAIAKLGRKDLDLIVLNDVSKPGIGMGSDDNAVTLIGSAGVLKEVPKSPKDVVAREIVSVVAQRWFS